MFFYRTSPLAYHAVPSGGGGGPPVRHRRVAGAPVLERLGARPHPVLSEAHWEADEAPCQGNPQQLLWTGSLSPCTDAAGRVSLQIILVYRQH